MLDKQKLESDTFQGHVFNRKHSSNVTVARHFASHDNTVDPRMTIHILENIRTLKDASKPSSLRHKGELVCIDR